MDLAKVPRGFHDRLIEAQVRVVVDENWRALPEGAKLSRQRPRGWPEGAAFDDVPGVYFPAERVLLIDTRSLDRGHGSSSLVLHEYGHAVDYELNADVLSNGVQVRSLQKRYARTAYERSYAEEYFAETFARWRLGMPITDDESDYFENLAAAAGGDP